jgi:hypothetical protein
MTLAPSFREFVMFKGRPEPVRAKAVSRKAQLPYFSRAEEN